MLDPKIIRWRLSGPDRVTVLRSLTRLREAIEPAAARQAAQTGDREARVRLAAAAEGMRQAVEAGDHDRFVAEDTAFHETLVTASGNDFFAALGRLITGVILGQTRSGVLAAEGDRSVRLHSAIADAVSAGQGAAAETAARALFTEMDKDLS
ncbi:FadR/GntR family transcriptional regulator [Streptomyces sp. NPDC055681]